MPPFSGLNSIPGLVACLVYSSTLKMEGICFSETSLNFYWTTRHNVPDDTLCLEHL
jgi:hypothetical protein